MIYWENFVFYQRINIYTVKRHKRHKALESYHFVATDKINERLQIVYSYLHCCGFKSKHMYAQTVQLDAGYRLAY